MNYTIGPADWRPWLGGMAWLNLAGLIAFRLARQVAAHAPRPLVRRELDLARFFGLGGALLMIAALAQLWLYRREGGIGGFIAAYEETKLAGETPFAGLGRVMMVAEVFPIVAFMLFAVAARRRARPLPAPAVLVMLTVLLAACLLFGGLRGSRSNTVWVIFWAAMVTDCWLRPLGRRWLLGGALFLVAFMDGYGLFKGVRGAEGLGDLWQGRLSIAAREERSQKPLSKGLLTDFGRGDIQTLILQRIATGAFEPVAGRTYLAAVAMIVPRVLWPERPPNKLLEGSELRFGPGAYSARYVSHFIHGLGGEAMINFGALAVVPAFVVYGCAIARIDRRQRALHADDPRMLLTPFLAILSIIMLTSDLDNLLWFLIKVAALPAALVWLTSHPAGSAR
jgi:hypothetical protein